MSNLIQWIDFSSLGDERGYLVALEGNKNIPFDIKRVYYIYGTKSNEPRGFHAHKNLQQVAIAMSGSCKMLLDNGKKKELAILDSPNKGILINSMIWHEMHDFSEDCVLLVLASDYYDESDYIRDYSGFIREVN